MLFLSFPIETLIAIRNLRDRKRDNVRSLFRRRGMSMGEEAHCRQYRLLVFWVRSSGDDVLEITGNRLRRARCALSGRDAIPWVTVPDCG